MNKIKIIDLLNMISREEEVPKRIKLDDIEYFYDETDNAEFYRYRGIKDEELLTDYANLNDEVEVIEEGIRKLPNEVQEPHNFEEVVYIAEDLGRKINEIIDKINKENI